MSHDSISAVTPAETTSFLAFPAETTIPTYGAGSLVLQQIPLNVGGTQKHAELVLNRFVGRAGGKVGNDPARHHDEDLMVGAVPATLTISGPSSVSCTVYLSETLLFHLRRGIANGVPSILNHSGDCGISVMAKKKQPHYVEMVDGVEMKVYRDEIDYRDKKTNEITERDVPRYRIFTTDPGYPSVLKSIVRDENFALQEMRRIGKAIAIERKYQSAKAGETVLQKAQALFARLAAFKVKDAVSFIEDACNAYKRMMEHWATPGIERNKKAPTLLSYVEKCIDFDRAYHPEKPTKVKVLVTPYIEFTTNLLQTNEISVATYKRRVSAARALEKVYGHRDVHTLTRTEIERFIDDLPDYREYRRVSIDNFLQWSQLHAKAIPPGKTIIAGVRKGSFIRGKGNAEDDVVEYHTTEQVKRIFAVALSKPHLAIWIPVLVLWYFGGIHFAEIIRMRFKHILRNGFINITTYIAGRNHSPRPVQLSPAAFSWIKEIVLLMRSEGKLMSRIVPNLDPDANPDAAYERLHRAWSKAYEEMCNDTGVKKLARGPRHSYATHLFHMTHNVKLLHGQMGSHFINLFQHYIAMEFTTTQAAAYFCIGHPDAGPFNPKDQWLPKKMYMKLEDAMHDILDLQSEEENRKGGMCKSA